MKKINAKYKILALIPLFALVGCKKHDIQEHKNVITGIVVFDNHKMFLMQDVETNQDRVLKLNDIYSDSLFVTDFNYMYLDDTLKIITGGDFLNEDYYQDNFILNDVFLGMDYNKDSIYARKQRGQFNIFEQNMKPNTR